MPSKFRLRSEVAAAGCAAVGGAETPDSASGLELQFRPCDDDDVQQLFTAKPLHGGFEIRTGVPDQCLDSAGGGTVLVYPCYEPGVRNMNQVWQNRKNQLIWPRDAHVVVSLDVELVRKSQVRPPQGEYTLQICAPKPGQRLQKQDVQEDGTFQLKDADEGTCLSALSQNMLGLAPCSQQHRWRELKDRHQVQHVESGNCIDAGGENRPILYPCHAPVAQRPQQFHLVDDPGWIQTPGSWGDNGRKRWFEKCLDRLPLDEINAGVRECDRAKAAGVRWERINVFKPLEWRLWEESDKPPPDAPILGGDADLPP